MISLSKYKLPSKYRKALDHLCDDDKVKFIIEKCDDYEAIYEIVYYYDLHDNKLLRSLSLIKISDNRYYQPTLDQLAKSAYFYSFNILKSRWIEAEDLIKQSAEACYLYAKNIIKARWIEAENIIKEDSFCAYNYAQSVVRGRWIEGEDAIKKNKKIWKIYSSKFIENNK